MVRGELEEDSGKVWLIDSGCSNHMSGARKLFQDLDDSVQQTVRLGDGKILKVAGKGTIVIKSSSGKL